MRQARRGRRVVGFGRCGGGSLAAQGKREGGEAEQQQDDDGAEHGGDGADARGGLGAGAEGAGIVGVGDGQIFAREARRVVIIVKGETPAGIRIRLTQLEARGSALGALQPEIRLHQRCERGQVEEQRGEDFAGRRRVEVVGALAIGEVFDAERLWRG